MDMTDLQRAIDTLVEVWEKFTASIKEMADALNKAFGVSTPEKEKKKESQFPGSIWNVSEEISKRIHR